MFKKLIAFTFLSAILLACNGNMTTSDISNKLEGKWEWVQSSGGIGGINSTPATSGSEIELYFNKDYSFYKLRNGDTVESGEYEVIRDKSLVLHDTVPILKMRNMRYILHNFNDTLIIMDDLFDGLTYKYVRPE